MSDPEQTSDGARARTIAPRAVRTPERDPPAPAPPPRMPAPEPADDGARARTLEALLVAMAERIQALHASGALLQHAGELNRLPGDVRREAFPYMVRGTPHTP